MRGASIRDRALLIHRFPTAWPLAVRRNERNWLGSFMAIELFEKLYLARPHTEHDLTETAQRSEHEHQLKTHHKSREVRGEHNLSVSVS